MAGITKLEQQEQQAVIKGDTATLKRLWTKEFVVNNPDGFIVTLPQIMGLIRSGKIDYTSFERIIEKITISGDWPLPWAARYYPPKSKPATQAKP